MQTCFDCGKNSKYCSSSVLRDPSISLCSKCLVLRNKATKEQMKTQENRIYASNIKNRQSNYGLVQLNFALSGKPFIVEI